MKTNAISAPVKNHDALLLVVASLVLTAELLLLFHQLRIIELPFSWTRDPASRVGIGEVLEKARSVQNRPQGSLTWYPLAEGDAIAKNDTVMTGASSTATVRLKDGAEIQLEPFTLLRFNEDTLLAGGHLALEVNRGLVKVRTLAKAVKLRIEKRDLSLAPDSEIVLSSTGEARASEIEVVAGRVAVQSASVDKTEIPPLIDLKAGEAATLNESPKLKVISRLQIRSVEPFSGSQAFFDGEHANIGFRWQGDAAQVLEWDTSPQMAGARRIPTQGHQVQARFPAGKYYWRLSRSDAQSAVMHFSVLPRAGYRVPNAIARYKGKEGSEVALRWERVPDAEGYVLEVGYDRSFGKLERRLSLRENRAELPPLAPGKYFWRVRATHSYLGDWPASPAFELNVKKRIEAPKPKGAKELAPKKTERSPDKPSEKGKRGAVGSKWGAMLAAVDWIWHSAWATDATVFLQFDWDATRGAKAYRLEVSAQKDFKTKLASTEGKKTSAVLRLPERTEYYWRVAAIDEDGDQGKFSAVQHLRREVAKVVTLPPPPTRQIASQPPVPSAPTGQMQGAEKSSDLPEIVEPPRARARRTWFGFGSGFVSQSVSGANFAVNGSGFAVQRYLVGFSYDWERITFEGHFAYQPLFYKSEGAQADFQLKQWGADFLVDNLLWRRSFPISTGLRLRNEARVLGLSGTDLTLQAIPFYAALIGTTWMYPGEFPWSGGVWLEIGPVGGRTGYGIVTRQRIGLPAKWAGLRPSVEFLLNVNTRGVAAVASRDWNWDASVSLVLEFEKGLPTLIH